MRHWLITYFVDDGSGNSAQVKGEGESLAEIMLKYDLYTSNVTQVSSSVLGNFQRPVVKQESKS